MNDLFTKGREAEKRQGAPLADRLRPVGFEDFVGQKDLVGEGSVLRRAIENDEL